MKPKPLVSVVIPAYNAARTLSGTIQSVFEQTVQDFEIIIVDDGSKDNTLEIARAIAASDSRVKLIAQPNSGASAARNAGIKAAAGEYIAFLDADDLWLPQKLERQIALLNSEKDVAAIQTGAFYVNDNLEVLSIRPCLVPKDVLLETLLFRSFPALMSTLLVKRSAFDKIGLLDTKLVILEDWELAIRLSRFCDLKSIEEPLALYRNYPGNRSRDLSIHIKPGHIILERLFQDPTLPAHIKQRRALIYSTFYRMLSGAAFNIGRYGDSLKFGVKSLLTHPSSLIYMASLPFRRLRRSSSRENVSEDYKAALENFLKRQTAQ
ncbi:MAG: glycosyltransferase [Acidobacteriota bacterium]|nr:glycosyltransferase [Acidobacteriota bacterium]